MGCKAPGDLGRSVFGRTTRKTVRLALSVAILGPLSLRVARSYCELRMVEERKPLRRGENKGSG